MFTCTGVWRCCEVAMKKKCQTKLKEPHTPQAKGQSVILHLVFLVSCKNKTEKIYKYNTNINSTVITTVPRLRTDRQRNRQTSCYSSTSYILPDPHPSEGVTASLPLLPKPSVLNQAAILPLRLLPALNLPTLSPFLGLGTTSTRL